MMRILALTNLYPNPYQPNRAAFNRQQFRALASQHEVQVIAPIAWTTELSALRLKQRATALTGARQRIADGMIVHHPRYVFTPKVLRGSYGAFFEHSVRRCFDDAVREFRPHVVLGCWAYPDGWAAVRLAREAGLPVAVKVQGSDLLTIDDQAARKERTVEAISNADAVIAVSRHLKTKAVEIGAPTERVHVVYNGVDSTTFRPGSKEAARSRLGLVGPDPVLLFVGNLVRVKGLDTLIDALEIVARSGQQFQCAFVGEGPLKAALQHRAEALGVSKCIRFVGSQPLDELPQWYCAADLVVLPSRSEGVPNVLLEATACGTPFIASRVGGIPEIAHPDSLVTSGNAPALAERIGAFLAGERRLLSHPTFEPQNWASSARSIADVLQRLVTARSNRTRLAS